MSMAGDIGFIGGGRMAEALIKGVIGADLYTADRVRVVEPVSERCQYLQAEYKVNASADAQILSACKVIILAVKPQVVRQVLGQYGHLNAGHLLVSIAAGVTIKLLEELLPECRVVRVMPNTPALVLEGAAGLSAGKRATDDDMTAASAIFDAVGSSVVLPESYLDAVTGLSGSGPAYVFSFIEAMVDAGVKVGLARPIAEKLVLQTVLGSVKLAMESGEHPAQLRAMVTSPGGTTIAGLHELERAGFQGIVMDAVQAAVTRSVELGEE